MRGPWDEMPFDVDAFGAQVYFAAYTRADARFERRKAAQESAMTLAENCERRELTEQAAHDAKRKLTFACEYANNMAARGTLPTA